MSRVVIALLDKGDPPTHSFVDGVLASRVPQQLHVRVHLYVARADDSYSSQRPRRYGSAVLIPVLHPRRGLGRIMNLPVAWSHLRRDIKRERRRGCFVTIFVRNDPILLLAAKLSKRPGVRLVFQSSFPHESAADGFVKRQAARLLYGWKAHAVDAVAAVSPLGLQRVKRMFPGSTTARWIPLLNDLNPQLGFGSGRRDVPLRFVYVGTHVLERRLDIVLAAACDILDEGCDAEFVLVGGTLQEMAQLCADPSVAGWVDRGRIRFFGRRERGEIPSILAQSDVGLCAIPDNPIFREASPTKLSEYLAAGLPVLATTGIPLQEQFLRESRAGVLVSFDRLSLGHAMRYLLDHPKERERLADLAADYGRRMLSYDRYIGSVAELIGPADQNV